MLSQLCSLQGIDITFSPEASSAGLSSFPCPLNVCECGEAAEKRLRSLGNTVSSYEVDHSFVPQRFGSAFEDYLRTLSTEDRTLEGQVCEFDEAFVLEGFHSTQSKADLNLTDHITVYEWFTLRPVLSESKFLPFRENAENQKRKQEKRRIKNGMWECLDHSIHVLASFYAYSRLLLSSDVCRTILCQP